jgi:hypothetical protein
MRSRAFFSVSSRSLMGNRLLLVARLLLARNGRSVIPLLSVGKNKAVVIRGRAAIGESDLP